MLMTVYLNGNQCPALCKCHRRGGLGRGIGYIRSLVCASLSSHPCLFVTMKIMLKIFRIENKLFCLNKPEFFWDSRVMEIVSEAKDKYWWILFHAFFKCFLKFIFKTLKYKLKIAISVLSMNLSQIAMWCLSHIKF